MRTITRSVVATALATLSSVALLLSVGAQPAQAADYYRYWAFFTVEDGAYVASQVGVGQAVPEDGTVTGYRWAAPADFNNPNLPRVDLAETGFEEICGDTDPFEGEKRVAVIVDYGVPEDAGDQEVPEPEAACAQVPTDANALAVLQDVAEVRSETGSFGPMLCGINGFPATGCADEVTQTATPADGDPVEVTVAGAETEEAAAESPEGSGDVAVYAGVGVLVLALGAAGLFLARRRNRASA